MILGTIAQPMMRVERREHRHERPNGFIPEAGLMAA
jgi:hypothetical protein